jgi:hypothetical protein
MMCSLRYVTGVLTYAMVGSLTHVMLCYVMLWYAILCYVNCIVQQHVLRYDMLYC